MLCATEVRFENLSIMTCIIASMYHDLYHSLYELSLTRSSMSMNAALCAGPVSALRSRVSFILFCVTKNNNPPLLQCYHTDLRILFDLIFENLRTVSTRGII